MNKKSPLRPVYSISLHIRPHGVTIRAGPYNKNFSFSCENKENDEEDRINREELGELAKQPEKYQRVGNTKYLSGGILLSTSQSQKLENILRSRAPIVEIEGVMYIDKSKLK